MMAENVTPIFSPNTEKMKEHLSYLFGSIPSAYDDGLIEISILNASKYFNVRDLDGAIEQAVTWNNQGKNVYTCPAVLSPDLFANIEKRKQADIAAKINKKGYRAEGEDFYCSSHVWVDVDEIEESKIPDLKAKYAACPPDYYVKTSTSPPKEGSKDKRIGVHFWWSVKDVIDLFEADKMELANKHLIANLMGDKGTHNRTRLMRLGGTISYPKKDYRVTEMVVCQNTANKAAYSLDEIIKSYPVTEEKPLFEPAPEYKPKNNSLSPFQVKGEWSLEDIQSLLDFIPPESGAGGKSGYYDWLQVGMALHDYGAPFEMWDNWCRRGAYYPKPNEHSTSYKWSTFKKGGGTSLGSVVRRAKQGGWRYASTDSNFTPVATTKIEIINPETGEITIEEKPTLNTIKATSIHDIDLDNIAPREFLYGDIIARKYVSMIIAPAGVGKSIFSMQLAVSAASSKPWGEWSSKQKDLNVWIYNNEEGNDELIRRLKAIMIENDLKKSDFKGNLYMDSGETQSITIAKVDRDGESVIATPDYDSLVAEIKERKIDILIIDPFAETHAVTENSNDKIKIVTGLYRKIAFDANCAVLLIHHARKGVENLAGNAEAGRGGGAQIGVVRRAFTIAKMSKEEAADIGVQPEKRHWYVRLDDAKSNITAPAESTTWFKFKSVSIGNGNVIYPDGDSVGVLKHTTIDSIKSDNGNVINAEEDRILQCIIEYSEKEGGKNFPFNDAKKYIQEFSSYNYGINKLTGLMKSAMDKNSITEYLGGRFKIKYMPNTSKSNANYIFIYEQE